MKNSLPIQHFQKLSSRTNRMILLCLSLLLSSCKEKTEVIPENEPQEVKTGFVQMHLHSYIDNTEVDDYNIAYTTDAGRAVKLTKAQFFISEIELIKENGKAFPVTGKIHLKQMHMMSYSLGEVPVGTYKGIRFKVGLSDSINELNPSQSNDSMLLKKTEMWMNTTPQPDGYVFLLVQGKVDTTADMSSPEEDLTNFSYRIGTDDNLVQVEMPEQSFVVQEGLTEYVHMLADYHILFQDIDLTDEGNLSIENISDNSKTVVQKIKTNIAQMFRYE